MARRLLTLLAALVLALSLGQPSATAASFSNPVEAHKGADPWIAYHDGGYHLVTTSWTDVITIRKAPTLAGLATAPGVQVRKGDAASRCCSIWAPELHFLGGRWYPYYVAGQNVADYNLTQRSHVLESAGSDPLGPCTSGRAGQRWRVEDLGDDTHRLVDAATGKVADVADCSTADSADVRQRSWLDNACQQWRLVPG
ncbi:family 43 glycosylhydrolase [Streptomyces sp. PRKS01-65]|nr:family 43 glycosylhydrolase [Streptomyces harenosi]NEY31189.1 family 43 glycosylhydrolase [Streptomyces harenosi]